MTIDQLNGFADHKHDSVAIIWGETGAGKTTLVSTFLRERKWKKSWYFPIYIDCRVTPTVPLMLTELKRRLSLNELASRSGTTAEEPSLCDEVRFIVERLVAQRTLIVLDNFYTLEMSNDARAAVIRNEQFVDLLIELLSAAPTAKFLFITRLVPKDLGEIAKGKGWVKRGVRPFDSALLVDQLKGLGVPAAANAPLKRIIGRLGPSGPSLLLIKLAAICLAVSQRNAGDSARHGTQSLEHVLLAALRDEKIEAVLAPFCELCPPDTLLAFRLIALTEDGLQPQTLGELLNHLRPKVGGGRWSLGDIDQLLSPVNALVEQVPRNGAGAPEYDIHDALRRALLSQWNHSDQHEFIRSAHRHIGRIAYQRARENTGGGDGIFRTPDTSATFRLLVQAYTHLLASVDPLRAKAPQLLEVRSLRNVDELLAQARECDQDRLNLAYTILEQALEDNSNALSRRFGANDLRLTLYMNLMCVGQIAPRLEPEDVFPNDQAQIPTDKVYDTVLERIAVAALRSHHLQLAHSAVRTGLARFPTPVGQETHQLLLTEIDTLIRQGRTEIALEKARFLAEHAANQLSRTSLGATSSEPLHQALVAFSRAHGRLGEILFLRGDLSGAASEFQESLFGYNRILPTAQSSADFSAAKVLKSLLDDSFKKGAVPALRPTGTTARKLLEFSVRAVRLRGGSAATPDENVDAIVQSWGLICNLHRTLGVRSEKRRHYDDAAAFQVDYSMLWRLESAQSSYSLSYKDANVLRSPVRRARERSWENRVSPITRIMIIQEEARLELHLAYAHFLSRERNWFDLARRCLKQARWLARILYSSVTPPKEYPLLQCDALLLEAEAQKALSEWQSDKTAVWREPLEQAEILIERFGYRKRQVDARTLRSSGTPWVGPTMKLIS